MFCIKTTSCSLINQVYHRIRRLSIPYFNYFSIIFFNSANISLPQTGQVESRSTIYFSSTIKPQFGHLIGAYFRGCSVRLRRFLSAMLNFFFLLILCSIFISLGFIAIIPPFYIDEIKNFSHTKSLVRNPHTS